MNQDVPSNSGKLGWKIALTVAIVSAAFSILMAALLLINYLQFKRVDPLNTPALPTLRKMMDEDPKDMQLREEIREVDLLARKAYFTSRNQIDTGSYLLLVGAIVFIISINIAFLLKKKTSSPPECEGINNPFTNAAQARRVLTGSIIFVLALIFFASFMMESDLPTDVKPPKQVPDHKPGKQPSQPQSTSLEVVVPSTEELKKNWPNFRGYEGNAVTKRQNVPTEWDGKSGKNIIWQTEVPMHGFSSPIVWDDKIFLSGGDKLRRQVMAFNRANGKLLWRKDVCEIPGSPAKPPKVTEDTGYAAATMTTNGQYVFAIFATGDLIAFTIDGEKVWGINIGVPENHYGHSSSLMLYKHILIVQFDHSAQTKLLGLNAATGNVVWENKRDGSISWSSPTVINTGKRTEIIVATSSIISAHDPENGKMLWSQNCLGGEVATSPAFSNGIVFEANDNATAVAIDTATGKIKWQSDELDLPDVASPVASEKYLFMATSTGLLICADANTGKLVWDKECDNGFYSSPILVNDTIYVTDMKGVTFIFKVDSKYNEVAQCKLGTDIVTTPAFVDDKIYIRTNKHLICIGNKAE